MTKTKTAEALLVITLDTEARTSLIDAIRKLERTFEGDSNDEEHDAAYDLVGLLQQILRLKPMQGRTQ